MKLGCPKCGANVEYVVGTDEVFCSTCNSTSQISQLIKTLNKNDSKIENYVSQYSCSQCGAKIISIDNSTVNVCNFCGSVNFQIKKMNYKLNKSKIIPFKYSKEDFLNNYKSFVSKNLISNVEFFSEEKITKISGLYVPVSINNYNMNFNSTGMVSFERKNNFKASPIKKYKYFYKSKYYLTAYYDLVRKLPDYLLFNLMPFNLDEVKSFSPYYFAGFSSPKVDDYENDKMRAISRDSIPTITKAIKTNFKGARKFEPKVNNIELSTVDEGEYYLPIWLCSYSHEGAIYSFAMNGQTGKIISTLPIDYSKYERIYKRAKRVSFFSTIANLIMILIEVLKYYFGTFSRYRLTEPTIIITFIIICLLIIIFYARNTMKKTMDKIKGNLDKQISNVDVSKSYKYKVTKIGDSKITIDELKEDIKETKNSLKLNGSEID